MATGPQHYWTAEKLIAAVTPGGTHLSGSPIINNEPHVIALAQAHAFLAWAAAFAMACSAEMPIADCDEWRAIASTPPA